MWQIAELHFPADHPTAAGHFPSHPIIPGALLLDEVVAAIADGGDEAGIVIHIAKFLQPVIPGERLSLRWHILSDGKVDFEIRQHNQCLPAVIGKLNLGARS